MEKEKEKEKEEEKEEEKRERHMTKKLKGIQWVIQDVQWAIGDRKLILIIFTVGRVQLKVKPGK
ncbi:uncharacterized, partial [Tachysurus ichikawai]